MAKCLFFSAKKTKKNIITKTSLPVQESRHVFMEPGLVFAEPGLGLRGRERVEDEQEPSDGLQSNVIGNNLVNGGSHNFSDVLRMG